MPLPDVDSLATAGGAVQDYSSVIDGTRERPAAGANAGFLDATSATHTVPRTQMRVQSKGTGTPVILFHDEPFNNAQNPAPTVQRNGVGSWSLIYANGTSGGTVLDELGNTHTLNLQTAVCTPEGVPLLCCVGISAPNILGLSFFNAVGASTTVDPPNGAVFNVWAR
jgi:hypothetical protein